MASQAPLLGRQRRAARGADEIFALHNGHDFALATGPVQRYVLSIGAHAISLLSVRQVQLEVEAVQRDWTVRLHLINLHIDDDPGLWNFSRAAGLIDAGRRTVEEYLTG